MSDGELRGVVRAGAVLRRAGRSSCRRSRRTGSCRRTLPATRPVGTNAPRRDRGATVRAVVVEDRVREPGGGRAAVGRRAGRAVALAQVPAVVGVRPGPRRSPPRVCPTSLMKKRVAGASVVEGEPERVAQAGRVDLLAPQARGGAPGDVAARRARAGVGIVGRHVAVGGDPQDLADQRMRVPGGVVARRAAGSPASSRSRRRRPSRRGSRPCRSGGRPPLWMPVGEGMLSISTVSDAGSIRSSSPSTKRETRLTGVVAGFAGRSRSCRCLGRTCNRGRRGASRRSSGPTVTPERPRSSSVQSCGARSIAGVGRRAPSL